LDAALIFEAIAGPDPWAPHSGKTALAVIRENIRGLRIGVPKQYFFSRLQPDIRRAIASALAIFEQLGAEICEVNLKGAESTGVLATDITAGEAFAYHANWLKKKPELYGEDLRSRLEQSANMPAFTYIQAQEKRKEYAGMMERVLDSVHLILTPTLPLAAPLIGQKHVQIGNKQEDVRTMLLSLTRPANLSGLPAISIPCGFSSEGLPIGLQLIGRRFDELTILRAGYAYESSTSWHNCFPPDPEDSGINSGFFRPAR
jgi:aspartyl-tRNA(Asn)/glutamyl-tRNA(Gln) amidotransferase subunit A